MHDEILRKREISPAKLNLIARRDQLNRTVKKAKVTVHVVLTHKDRS